MFYHFLKEAVCRTTVKEGFLVPGMFSSCSLFVESRKVPSVVL